MHRAQRQVNEREQVLRHIGPGDDARWVEGRGRAPRHDFCGREAVDGSHPIRTGVTEVGEALGAGFADFDIGRFRHAGQEQRHLRAGHAALGIVGVVGLTGL